SQGVTRDQLVWTADAYIRSETYQAALVRIIDAHHRLPVAALWGAGTTSSSDGQFFRSEGNSPFYVHSKTWIFDDEFLISGSANCNRRGYSHDSELDFAVCSPTTDFVKQTRIRLWRRRLFTEGFKGASPPSDADLADFNAACK